MQRRTLHRIFHNARVTKSSYSLQRRMTFVDSGKARCAVSHPVILGFAWTLEELPRSFYVIFIHFSWCKNPLERVLLLLFWTDSGSMSTDVLNYIDSRWEIRDAFSTRSTLCRKNGCVWLCPHWSSEAMQVSFSNPVRQSLFTHKDAAEGRKKARTSPGACTHTICGL